VVVALVGALAVLAVPGAAWGVTPGAQQFRVVIAGPDNAQQSTVVASGVLNATGKDVEVSATASSGVDRFVFPHGSLRISHTRHQHSESFDPRSCTARFSESGTFKVVGGTGAYVGASGGGTYQLHGTFMGQRTAKGCGRGGTGLVVVHATGHLGVPGAKAA